MRALVLSDIHGNLEALTAVLAAAGQWDELWNLGDIVGYGASPNEVLHVIRPLATITVRGNHDRICCGLTSPRSFNPIARAAAQWTQAALTEENRAWLRELPQGPLDPQRKTPHEARVTLAHGSPLDEDHYIRSMRDAWLPLQQMTATLAFFGHTHLQGGFTQREHEWNELRPPCLGHDGDQSWTLPIHLRMRCLINPGSVGQPRDFDWRAAFALYDSEAREVVFRRVPYDVAAAQQRVLQAGLPTRLAARLRQGR